MNRLEQARHDAAEALADLTLTPEDRIAKVVKILPGGSRSVPEYDQACELASSLQKQSPIINCGACYNPERCITYQHCTRF